MLVPRVARTAACPLQFSAVLLAALAVSRLTCLALLPLRLDRTSALRLCGSLGCLAYTAPSLLQLAAKDAKEATHREVDALQQLERATEVGRALSRGMPAQ